MQTRHPPRIMVLGHSFVWRLEKFVAESSLACVNDKFQLSMSPTTHFCGTGGRTMTKLRRFDLPVVAQFNPTVLILELGSNDLCNPYCDINYLASDIFDLVQAFHFQYNIKHIIVSAVMPRRTPPILFPPYNTRVSILNGILYHSLKNTPFATFWFHPSIFRSKTPVFLPDGVHLNSTGNHLLYHSYQKALLRYFSRALRNGANTRTLFPPRPLRRSRRRRTQSRLSPKLTR